MEADLSHRHDGKVVRFFHNGDFSGDVRMLVPPHFVSIKGIVVSSAVEHVEIEIPMSDILGLVAEAVRANQIGKLEQMSVAELLGLEGIVDE